MTGIREAGKKSLGHQPEKQPQTISEAGAAVADRVLLALWPERPDEVKRMREIFKVERDARKGIDDG